MKVSRHVYQSAEGGKIYAPMEQGARVLRKSTPRLAKLVQSKYVEGSADRVKADLNESRKLKLSRHFIQDLSQAVSKVMIDKEMQWSYALPQAVNLGAVKSVSVSRDGTTTHIVGQGWRETMCGSLMLNDENGEPLHCIYVSTAPEYGKATFNMLLEREIEQLRRVLNRPLVWQGLADGTADNWSFLEQHVQIQTLDFYHAGSHLHDFAKAAIRRKGERQAWVETMKSKWLEEPDGAREMMKQMEEMAQGIQSKKKQEEADVHMTYFTNQVERMNYFEMLQQGYPIGSGVIESACKHVVKQRLAQAGMRWKLEGVDDVLVARALKRTPGRWNQFWSKFSRYGCN